MLFACCRLDVRRDLGTTFVFVSHDCGVIVETLDAARTAAGDVAHPCTRELLVNCYVA